jgi:hypothetical protein
MPRSSRCSRHERSFRHPQDRRNHRIGAAVEFQWWDLPAGASDRVFMHWWTRLACTAHAALLAQPTARAQAVTPPPAAEPLIPDWIWMAAIVLVAASALWYFLRRRRG